MRRQIAVDYWGKPVSKNEIFRDTCFTVGLWFVLAVLAVMGLPWIGKILLDGGL